MKYRFLAKGMVVSLLLAGITAPPLSAKTDSGNAKIGIEKVIVPANNAAKGTQAGIDQTNKFVTTPASAVMTSVVVEHNLTATRVTDVLVSINNHGVWLARQEGGDAVTAMKRSGFSIHSCS